MKQNRAKVELSLTFPTRKFCPVLQSGKQGNLSLDDDTERTNNFSSQQMHNDLSFHEKMPEPEPSRKIICCCCWGFRINKGGVWNLMISPFNQSQTDNFCQTCYYQMFI